MNDSNHNIIYLHRAIQLAREAEHRGNLSIGAVICLDGAIVAEGMNSIWQPEVGLTRHAEMEALRSVSTNLWSRSRDMTLFTTLEPCLMCAGAILLHQIGQLIFGARDPYGGVGVTAQDWPPRTHCISQFRACTTVVYHRLFDPTGKIRNLSRAPCTISVHYAARSLRERAPFGAQKYVI